MGNSIERKKQFVFSVKIFSGNECVIKSDENRLEKLFYFTPEERKLENQKNKKEKLSQSEKKKIINNIFVCEVK